MDLSIVILNYNTKDIILKCLQSVIDSKLENIKYEIIIVDNASSDGSVKVFKDLKNKNSIIKIVENQQNLGFAAGNNKGIRLAKGKLILILNSDVVLETDTLINQIKFMKDNSKYSVSSCKLELINGKMDPACHRGFPTVWNSFCYFSKLESLFSKTKLFGGYHQGYKNFEKIHAVDVISGAFFMLKKEVFEKVGLFDEGFFMYGEDIDLCLRIKEAGYKIGFNPNASAIHLKGESGIMSKAQNLEIKKETKRYFWETMKLFYQKHYVKKYPRFLMWLIFKVIDWKKNKNF